MNEDILKGKWHEMKGEVKKQWGKLTDDDLKTISGAVSYTHLTLPTNREV